MAASWTFVLGLTLWAFARILGAEKRRKATLDPADDMTPYERVPPTG